MASDQTAGTRPPGGGKDDAAALARDLVRRAWKGTLGTIARSGGFPYASLVAMATEPGGAPLLLLSGLAEHTKNIEADQRVSILIDGTSADRAALTGARVTLVGRIREADPSGARRRYLARHPDAEGFIDFADFKLYAVDIEWAHLVAGFGRIVRLQPSDVLIETRDAATVIDAEPSIIEHMNADHSDAIAAMAEARIRTDTTAPAAGATGSASSSVWRMIGCDPDGVDATDGKIAVRLRFSKRVTTPGEVRDALVDMVREVRRGANS